MPDRHGPIRPADVAHYPAPGTAVPTAIRFSPEAGWVTWLHSPERTLERTLFAAPLTGAEPVVRPVLRSPEAGVSEENLSLEEQLRRERTRDLGLGVTRYAWAEKADVLVVPLADGVHVQRGVDGDRRLLVASAAGSVLDPRPSPDGSRVAFVRGGELHVVAVDGAGQPRQVTQAREDGVTNGLAEFVAQEEMGRAEGYWWSPDGARLAFTEVDERHIPAFRILHPADDQPASEEVHRYPFAGGSNARVRLGVVGAEGGGEVVWMDLPGPATGESYLARVHWTTEETVMVEVEDRRQQQLHIVRCDVATGAAITVHTEHNETWINLHDCFRPLPGDRFLWASERSGFRHLEVRHGDGSLERVLTEGQWGVESVAGVDDGTVWFTGTRDSPLERHLYAVDIAGGELRRLTGEPGTHAVVAAPDHGCFVDTWSTVDRPSRVALRSLADGGLVRMLFDDPDPAVERLDLSPPQLETVKTRDGEELHVALYLPDGPGPHPLVLHVYGGPHVQRVTNSWAPTADMRAQHLRQLGCAVARVDNRGSWGRGLAFEAAIRWSAGDVEVRDQADAVAALAERGLVDPRRVAVVGWSYGGYLAAMCLARAPETFAAAVAGAPLIEWEGYDTHYAERYLGLPTDNREGYRSSSVITHVGAIRGELLLIHGLLDENVHFRHTARLVDALIAARVPHRLLVFPRERHSPRSEGDRVFLEEQVTAFLAAALELAAG